MLIDFGIAIAAEEIHPGDPVKNVFVDGILEQICILSDLKIPDLEAEN
jgi:hypothetical protein